MVVTPLASLHSIADARHVRRAMRKAEIGAAATDAS
jgi:hypothetical protein